jgi:hypothetical protein
MSTVEAYGLASRLEWQQQAKILEASCKCIERGDYIKETDNAQ